MDRQTVYSNYVPSTSSNSNNIRLITFKPYQPNSNYMYQYYNQAPPVEMRRPNVVPALKQVQQTPNEYNKTPRALIRTPETPAKEHVFYKQRPLQMSMPDNHNNFMGQITTPIRASAAPQKVDTASNHSFNLNNNDSASMIVEERDSNITSNFQPQLLGATEREKMFTFTGTVEKVIKWNKIFVNHFCYFEVIGSVISIQEGSIRQQKIMLLRDKKGPILQVIYYESTHIDISDFYVGKMLRCIGSMNGNNVLNAVSIRNATEDEVDTLQRLSLICDQAISHYLNV